MKAKSLSGFNNYNEAQLTALLYDGNILKIAFETKEDAFELMFDQLVGFRCLDEGDLVHYWKNENLTTNWIVEIFEGGWLDLESSTGGFLSNIDGGCREFFIMTSNECISVIAGKEPKFQFLPEAIP